MITLLLCAFAHTMHLIFISNRNCFTQSKTKCSELDQHSLSQPKVSFLLLAIVRYMSFAACCSLNPYLYSHCAHVSIVLRYFYIYRLSLVIKSHNNRFVLNASQRASESRILQLAPSVEHQAAAMLGILTRYSWHVFTIITSNIGGHGDFVRAVRDQISSIDNFK